MKLLGKITNRRDYFNSSGVKKQEEEEYFILQGYSTILKLKYRNNFLVFRNLHKRLRFSVRTRVRIILFGLVLQFKNRKSRNKSRRANEKSRVDSFFFLAKKREKENQVENRRRTRRDKREREREREREEPRNRNAHLLLTSGCLRFIRNYRDVIYRLRSYFNRDTFSRTLLPPLLFLRRCIANHRVRNTNSD